MPRGQPANRQSRPSGARISRASAWISGTGTAMITASTPPGACSRDPITHGPLGHVHRIARAEFAGERSLAGLPIGRDDPARAARRGEHHVQQAHRARAVDHDRVARLDPRSPLCRDDAGERLGERGGAAGRCRRAAGSRGPARAPTRGIATNSRVGPVPVDPEGRVRRAHVAHPLHAHIAVAAADVGGHADPLAQGEAVGPVPLTSTIVPTNSCPSMIVWPSLSLRWPWCRILMSVPQMLAASIRTTRLAGSATRFGCLADGEAAPLRVAGRDHAVTPGGSLGTGPPVRSALG